MYVAWQKQLLCEHTPAANVGGLIIIKPLDRPHRGCSVSSGGTGAISQITLRITLELHLYASVSQQCHNICCEMAFSEL